MLWSFAATKTAASTASNTWLTQGSWLMKKWWKLLAQLTTMRGIISMIQKPFTSCLTRLSAPSSTSRMERSKGRSRRCLICRLRTCTSKMSLRAAQTSRFSCRLASVDTRFWSQSWRAKPQEFKCATSSASSEWSESSKKRFRTSNAKKQHINCQC